jgi:hypothetical protein
MVFVLIIASCAKDPYIGSTNLYGKWNGNGEFNNVKLNQKAGEFHFDIEITNDNSVTGTIGDAKIIDSKIGRHITFKEKDGNNLKCKLEGKIHDSLDFKKKISILMYVEGKEKTWTNFYYGGRVGGVTLTKETK